MKAELIVFDLKIGIFSFEAAFPQRDTFGSVVSKPGKCFPPKVLQLLFSAEPAEAPGTGAAQAFVAAAATKRG